MLQLKPPKQMRDRNLKIHAVFLLNKMNSSKKWGVFYTNLGQEQRQAKDTDKDRNKVAGFWLFCYNLGMYFLGLRGHGGALK